MATNHPSFFYYAVNSNVGAGAADKNLAAGLAVMKQDIVCAAWHAEMGRNPGADPKAVFKMSADKWKDRDADLLELVKRQAGIPKVLEAKEVSLEAVKPLMPSAEEVEELERRFYASNSQHPAQEDNESPDGSGSPAPNK